MANTQAICNSFKTELFNGTHIFGTGTPDSFKAALFLTTATIGAATTAYAVTGEVSGTGYTAGGIAVPNATAPSLSGSTLIWTPSGSLSWTGLTAGPFDCVLIYNSSKSNKAVAAYTFGAQTLTAGNLNLTMPVNDATHALIQVN